jgi:small subunit ribosomal protein S1
MSEIMNEDEKNGEENLEEDFAELLEHSFLQTEKLEPGRKVEARILKITQDWIFLDVGQKGEGVLDRKELLDAEGNLTVKEGDLLPAYFQGAKGGELLFATRLSSGGAGLDRLEEAWRNGIPVEGVIEKEVKGGVEVKISGSIRAFCPFSQMDVRRSEPSENMVGKRMEFKVIQFDERGRNIVVSHRALLEEERARQKEQMKQTLQEGMKVGQYTWNPAWNDMVFRATIC